MSLSRWSPKAVVLQERMYDCALMYGRSQLVTIVAILAVIILNQYPRKAALYEVYKHVFKTCINMT